MDLFQTDRRFNIILIKVLAMLFCRNRQTYSKIHIYISCGKGRPGIVKTTLKRKNKVGAITLLDGQLYCIATVILVLGTGTQ